MKINREKAFLVLLIFALVGIGILMIGSASMVYARDNYGDDYYFLKRQVVWLAAGLLFFRIGCRIDYHYFRKYSRLILLAGLALLLLVFIPGLGRSAGGARRWLNLAGFSFQPSELAKYLLIIYLADLLARHQDRSEKLACGFLPPLTVIGIAAVLIISQPDLGSALSISLVGMIMLFAAGARIVHLLSLAVLSLPALYLLIFRVAYRRQRILSFLNPQADSQGAGFQIIQSLLALGSGGIRGVGLGESRQKLFYLPACSTDFIFSILGEELGLIGTLLVVALFFGLLWTGFSIARKAPDLYGCLLAGGITSMLALQAFINMGVSTGILPTKGLPLPFVSYGGSNLICSFLAAGILFNIASHHGRECSSARAAAPVYFLNREPLNRSEKA